jgi:hypothetical protein
MISVSAGLCSRTRAPRSLSIFPILDLPNSISSDEASLFVESGERQLSFRS